MTSVRATPFVFILLGLMFAIFPATLVRREDQHASGFLGFMSSLFGGLLSFVPRQQQTLAARALGISMLASGIWMLSAFQGSVALPEMGGGVPATVASLVEPAKITETPLPIVEESTPVERVQEMASVQEAEKEELIDIATSDDPSPAPEILVADENDVETPLDPASETESSLMKDFENNEDGGVDDTDVQSGTRTKPTIPDEPSPFIDTFPKPVAPKAEAPKADAKKAPVARNTKPAPKPPADPFGAAKTAPVAPKATPRPAPKVVEPAEPEIVSPPAEPNPAKLAEADELLKKANMMWELEEYASSVKLAEKARKIRVSQLGEDHSKVAEVDAMLEVARAKLTNP